MEIQLTYDHSRRERPLQEEPVQTNRLQKKQKNERKKHQLVRSVQLCEDRGRYIHTLRKADWVWRRRAEGWVTPTITQNREGFHSLKTLQRFLQFSHKVDPSWV